MWYPYNKEYIMEHLIDINKHIDLAIKKEQKDKMEAELIQLEPKLNIKKENYNNRLKDKEKYNRQIAELNTLKNKLFGGTRVKRELATLNNYLSVCENHLEQSNKEIQLLEPQIKKLKDKLAILKQELQGYDYGYCEEVENDMLVITDKSKGKYKSLSGLDAEKHTDELAIVHYTDFFPQDDTILTNYDGNKISEVIAEYNGVKKKVKVLSHRHTSHFTLNSLVQSTGDGFGNWDQRDFIVVEPFKKHQEQFLIVDAADSYTKGSVKLQQPYYLVREDAISNIPIPLEELKGKVVLYRGDAHRCLINFLDELGYPAILDGDPRTPGHYNSIEYKLESTLESRDIAINYIMNNSFNGKDKLSLSTKEITKILDIQLTLLNKYTISILDRETSLFLEQKLGVSWDLLETIIGDGIKMNSDGTFTFASDEEIYEVINDLSKLDVENLQKVCNAYKSAKEQLKEQEVQVELNPNLTTEEMFKFENQAQAEKFFAELKSQTTKQQIDEQSQQYRFVKTPYVSEDGLYTEINNYSYGRFVDTELIKLADSKDSLSIAYANFEQQLNNINSLNRTEEQTLIRSRGNFNIFYLLIIIGIILFGVIVANILVL